MEYLAIASDYDGTLAHDGVVDKDTIQAIELLVSSGRKLILVTGRELEELLLIFPRLDLCERVVAENGAVLYHPAFGEKRRLAEQPPPSFIESLRERGVSDLSVGEVIISSWREFSEQVLEAIYDSGLDLQVILNKESLMILRSGTDKKTGLRAALDEVRIPWPNTIGVGDAENDQALLEACGLSAAVANAIPSLKEQADLVTQGSRGAGVREIIAKLIQNEDLLPT